MSNEKKDFQIAVENYVEAERAYRALEEHFLDGSAAIEIAQRANGDPEIIKREFQSLVGLLKKGLEDLNAKLTTAKGALRQVVQLTPTQQRGPEGEATKFSYGPLTVTSSTKRWFDAKSLLRLAAKHGILEQLMSLTNFDKDGKEYSLVETNYVIDFENVYKWLKAQNLTNIIDGAYDEKEGTPSVGGAKRLAFLGDKVEG